MGILRVLILVCIGLITQAQQMEIPEKFLDNKVPDSWEDSGDRTFREYVINYQVKEDKALIFVGHYKTGKTSRLNPTQKEEIERFKNYFNQNLADESTINNYRDISEF